MDCNPILGYIVLLLQLLQDLVERFALLRAAGTLPIKKKALSTYGAADIRGGL